MTSDWRIYQTHARFVDADIFRLRGDCQATKGDTDEQCDYSARYFAINDAQGEGFVVRAACGLHVPDEWLEDPAFEVFDTDEGSCGKSIYSKTGDPPWFRNCGYAPFIAVRDFEDRWDSYCRIHARPVFLRALERPNQQEA